MVELPVIICSMIGFTGKNVGFNDVDGRILSEKDMMYWRWMKLEWWCVYFVVEVVEFQSKKKIDTCRKKSEMQQIIVW